MKGLYYSYLVQKKGFLIATAIVAVLIAALGCTLILLSSNESISEGARWMSSLTAGLVIVYFPVICAVIPGEGLNRDLEASVKCRFQNYIFSGMTYSRFCNIELVKSLATQAVSLAAIGFCDLMFLIADPTAMTWEIFAGHVMVALLGNIINWLAMPMTAVLKSQEKAGLILGIVLASIIVPLMIYALEKGDELDLSWVGEPLTMIIAVASTAVLYALGYLIFYKVMKRGDLC